jgi:hypothetical protein
VKLKTSERIKNCTDAETSCAILLSVLCAELHVGSLRAPLSTITRSAIILSLVAITTRHPLERPHVIGEALQEGEQELAEILFRSRPTAVPNFYWLRHSRAGVFQLFAGINMYYDVTLGRSVNASRYDARLESQVCGPQAAQTRQRNARCDAFSSALLWPGRPRGRPEHPQPENSRERHQRAPENFSLNSATYGLLRIRLAGSRQFPY